MTSEGPRVRKFAMLPSADLSYDSGSVIFAKQLANSLVNDGAEVHILAKCAPKGVSLDFRVRLEVQPELLEHPVVTDRAISDEEFRANEYLCRRFLAAVQSRGAIDLVYAQYLSFTSASAVEFAKEHGVSVIVSSFGRDIDVGVDSDVRFLEFAKRTLSGVNTIVVPTEAVANKVRELAKALGMGAPRLFVAPPPVDVEFLHNCSEFHVPLDGTPLIVTINSCFKPDKGIETILEAVAALKSMEYPDVRLVVAGIDDHPLQANVKRLESLIHRVGLTDSVSFPGYLDRAGVGALLRQADIFVDARMTSGFSSVLVEALACGAATCCSSNEASRSLVRAGENALLFTPGRPQELLAQIRALLGDKGLTARLRTNARQWFATEGISFGSDHVFAKLKPVFWGSGNPL
jgi:L-malate glycosyltransferase